MSAERSRIIGGREGSSGAREVSVPVSEERLEVDKRKRKAGEVRVSKNVVTFARRRAAPRKLFVACA